MRPSNWTLYLIHGVDCSKSVNNNRVQVFSYDKYFLLFVFFVRIEPGTSKWIKKLLETI